ncbi:hypothetical protein CJ195_19640 [Bacillus sp. UMB0899]|nr:hypothetical protein CJ195_19640 [Bacillus sp. UMB0899]
MSKRLLYAMLILNMLTNIVAYVPTVLIENRSEGSLLGILLAFLIGMFIIYFFTKYMSEFPGQGIPEILEKFTPKWFRTFYLLFQGILWFMAGFVTLIAFTHISKQYINPEMDELVTILLFLVVIFFGASRDSKKVLYSIEIILLINLPFIAFVIFKSYTNQEIIWDSMRVALTYYHEMPSFETISTATFVYTGYANLVIFNRYFKEVKVGFFSIIIIGLLGFFTLITTFFIPIGVHGFDGVGSYTFPWIATTEGLRIELGFIERVSFLFLALYINVSIASVTMHWHVGMKQLEAILPIIKRKDKEITSIIILGIFSLLGMVSLNLLDVEIIGSVAKVWMIILLPAQLIGIVVLKVILKRRDKLEK